ncbi:MAG TPA: glycosyltransferase [Patescibacteria group bacterium]
MKRQWKIFSITGGKGSKKGVRKVVIVIPTYNEEENIGDLIPAIINQQQKLPEFDLNILVADSHSPDKTSQIVTKISQNNPKVHYLDVKKRGIGVGLIYGFNFGVEKLGADILMQMDGDLSHNPNDIPKLLNALNDNTDLVIGSRFVKGGSNNLSLIRRIFSFGASIVSRLLTGFYKVHEWTTSFRAFKADLYKKINVNAIPWQKPSFVFQIAFVVEALRAKANFAEVPIVFVDRKRGRSKMNTFRYIFDVIVYDLRVRARQSAIMIKFLVVGTIGFLINSALLYLLYDGVLGDLFLPTKGTSMNFILGTHPDIRLLASSIIAVESSILSNFILHEKWTFRRRPQKGFIGKRFIEFNITSIGSPIISVATVNVLTTVFGIFYLFSNAIGVLLGLSWNYIWNTRVIWSAKSSKSKQTVVDQ